MSRIRRIAGYVTNFCPVLSEKKAVAGIAIVGAVIKMIKNKKNDKQP